MAANTDTVTPTIFTVDTKKRIEGDCVFVYMADDSRPEYTGIGEVSQRHYTTLLRVDIRTFARTSQRAHLIKMLTEARRILNAYIKSPYNTNYHFFVGTERDLSDKSIFMGRFILNCEVREFNRAIS